MTPLQTIIQRRDELGLSSPSDDLLTHHSVLHGGWLEGIPKETIGGILWSLIGELCDDEKIHEDHKDMANAVRFTREDAEKLLESFRCSS